MLGPFQEHIEADHPIVNGPRSLLPLLIPVHVGEAVCAAHLLRFMFVLLFVYYCQERKQRPFTVTGPSYRDVRLL